MTRRERRRGRFVTLEGGEGAGKTTQARRLAARLASHGVQCLVTREPGGTPAAEEIRALVLRRAAGLGALSEALLFNAARAEHLAAVIRPALEAGQWVVCDRFMDSTRAYQGAARGLAPHDLDALERMVVGPTRPDLTLLFDLPPEDGLRRARQRRAPGDVEDAFEAEAIGFHRELRAAFRAIAAAEPGRVRVIDASRAEDAVAEAAWDAVRAALGAEWREADDG